MGNIPPWAYLLLAVLLILSMAYDANRKKKGGDRK